ncbi:unnamed protein product, partial [Candidula unifasciata]
MAADGDFYQWIIEGQPGEVLKIEFDALTIEDHMENVRVYSGGPSIVTSDLIQDIRNKLIPEDLTNFAFCFYVKFVTDTEASWKQVNIVDVTNEASYISSPYYDSSMAPVSFKREWLLNAPEGELITLEVI